MVMPRHRRYAPSTAQPDALFDRWLLAAICGLLIIGLLMVASSSIMISTSHYQQAFHFLIRQTAYVLAGAMLGMMVLRIESSTWQKWSGPLLLLCVLLLILVLIPGIGRSVNGSRRWIAFGPLGIQVSEMTKLGMILYTSSYLVRHADKIQQSIQGFAVPMIILALLSILLLLEPDFGATAVLSATILTMLFLAGIPLRYFLMLLLITAAGFSFLAISEPYRMARITSFLNPWADQFNSGYQLTQSLIAFGRGGWLGVGLGDSVQKLFYLPEAHTDFLFAVLAEETGLLGIFVVILLYSILVFRGMTIAWTAQQQQRFFAAQTAYGISFWLGLQAFINMGVNAGLLPTKGLTLPLLSYGGASIIINCVSVAILIRVDYENRWYRLTKGQN